jgi:hypothetical protein
MAKMQSLMEEFVCPPARMPLNSTHVHMYGKRKTTGHVQEIHNFMTGKRWKDKPTIGVQLKREKTNAESSTA